MCGKNGVKQVGNTECFATQAVRKAVEKIAKLSIK